MPGESEGDSQLTPEGWRHAQQLGKEPWSPEQHSTIHPTLVPPNPGVPWPTVALEVLQEPKARGQMRTPLGSCYPFISSSKHFSRAVEPLHHIAFNIRKFGNIDPVRQRKEF